MNMISAIHVVGFSGCQQVLDGLQAAFGSVLAERIFEAEALDFLWEARVQERYLGQQIGLDFDDEDASQELSRVAILSFLDGIWHVGMCLVDGEGCAVELLWRRKFEERIEAETTLLRAR